MDRRLTTVLAADLVGFSRMMAADEEGVIARLRAARAAVVDPAVAEAGGRIVKTMGDGLLIEFASPVAAVRAALAVQRSMATLPFDTEGERLRFRMGIHLGDVVIDGDDILGDGVNVAARLESLAPAGGVCISRTVQELVRGKIDAPLTALGPQTVKNLPEPVEVWLVQLPGADAVRPVTEGARPSIVILPFANMSRDPDQDFLADGIVEDVIAALGRFRDLTVIARASSFRFRGKDLELRQVAQDLGARYVVEGSVRRAGARLRITAELSDARDGSQVWAGRWDRTMDDLFDLQDELTQAIVGAVAPEIGAHERILAARKPPDSLTAWELAQRAHAEFLRYTPEAIASAKVLAQRALAVDSGIVLAQSLLARALTAEAMSSACPDRQATLRAARAAGERAVQLDARSDAAHAALGFALRIGGRHDDGVRALERARELNPNNATTLLHLATAYLDHPTVDHASRALDSVKAAMRLSPTDPLVWVFQTITAVALARLGEHRAALEAIDGALGHPGADWKPAMCGAVIALAAGDRERARALLADSLSLQPDLTVAAALRGAPALAVPPLRDAAERLVELGLPSGAGR